MSTQGAIIAIGGGSIGRTSPATTTPIDTIAIELTGTKNPNVLFLPTAHRDDESYVEAFTKHYGETLGCTVKPLYLYDKRADYNEMTALMDWAQLIYVGGGNPIRMLKRWRVLAIDILLRDAYEHGKVLAGMSAGAICWFEYGLTDCWRGDHDPNKAQVARGLKMVTGLCNPHYTKDTWRPERAKTALTRIPSVSIGIDDNAAVVIQGDQFQVVNSQPDSWAYRSLWQEEKYIEERLPESGVLADVFHR